MKVNSMVLYIDVKVNSIVLYIETEDPLLPLLPLRPYSLYGAMDYSQITLRYSQINPTWNHTAEPPATAPPLKKLPIVFVRVRLRFSTNGWSRLMLVFLILGTRPRK